MVNSSDMNPVKNELTVSNFSVYGKLVLDRKLSKFTLDVKITTKF